MHISHIAMSAVRRGGSALMEMTMSDSPVELGHNHLPWNKGRSKPRACDLVRLQTTDICLGGRVKDRAIVVQKKTGRHWSNLN